jgi:hypothetical protein
MTPTPSNDPSGDLGQIAAMLSAWDKPPVQAVETLIDELNDVGAECSRLEADILAIADAINDGQPEGDRIAINASAIVEWVEAQRSVTGVTSHAQLKDRREEDERRRAIGRHAPHDAGHRR